MYKAVLMRRAFQFVDNLNLMVIVCKQHSSILHYSNSIVRVRDLMYSPLLFRVMPVDESPSFVSSNFLPLLIDQGCDEAHQLIILFG